MTKLLNNKRLEHFKPIQAHKAMDLMRPVWDNRGVMGQHLRARLQVRACDIILRMMLGKSFESCQASHW
jgi:hypothetical protein